MSHPLPETSRAARMPLLGFEVDLMGHLPDGTLYLASQTEQEVFKALHRGMLIQHVNIQQDLRGRTSVVSAQGAIPYKAHYWVPIVVDDTVRDDDGAVLLEHGAPLVHHLGVRSQITWEEGDAHWISSDDVEIDYAAGTTKLLAAVPNGTYYMPEVWTSNPHLYNTLAGSIGLTAEDFPAGYTAHHHRAMQELAEQVYLYGLRQNQVLGLACAFSGVPFAYASGTIDRLESARAEGLPSYVIIMTSGGEEVYCEVPDPSYAEAPADLLPLGSEVEAWSPLLAMGATVEAHMPTPRSLSVGWRVERIDDQALYFGGATKLLADDTTLLKDNTVRLGASTRLQDLDFGIEDPLLTLLRENTKLLADDHTPFRSTEYVMSAASGRKLVITNVRSGEQRTCTVRYVASDHVEVREAPPLKQRVDIVHAQVVREPAYADEQPVIFYVPGMYAHTCYKDAADIVRRVLEPALPATITMELRFVGATLGDVDVLLSEWTRPLSLDKPEDSRGYVLTAEDLEPDVDLIVGSNRTFPEQ